MKHNYHIVKHRFLISDELPTAVDLASVECYKYGLSKGVPTTLVLFTDGGSNIVVYLNETFSVKDFVDAWINARLG